LKILIPDELPYSTGVESVVLSIVKEWLQQVDAVTWIVRDNDRVRTLREQLGAPTKLVFETYCEKKTQPFSRSRKTQPIGIFKSFVKIIPFIQRKAYAAYRSGIDQRIHQLAKASGASHCWFHFVQGQSVPRLAIPVAGLVHDQNFRFFPENLPKGKGRQFENALLDWLRNADLVTVLSQAGKEEIHQLVASPASRIEIIPNAITPPNTPVPLLSRETPHFLYPAAALSHKNHILLFQAALLLKEISCKYKIILCGKDTDLFDQSKPISNPGVEAARQFYQNHKQALASIFEFKGNCSRQELDRLYSSVRAVVLPTKYEGFGLPLVEALSRSTPVFCSQLVPFEEQVSRYDAENWVRFFNPEDPSTLAGLFREELLASGHSFKPQPFPIENFSSWTWGDVAAKYMDLFTELSLRKGKSLVSV